MLITDPISDLFIRIKNGLMAKKKEVNMPHSKLKEAIAHKLVENNYIEAVEIIDKIPQKEMNIKLRYVEGLAGISGFKRISKPGRRLYSGANKVPPTLNGYGITLVSTNRGVLTDKEAREKNVGGELICQIW
jgi:small subunit ribosomal protein S8